MIIEFQEIYQKEQDKDRKNKEDMIEVKTSEEKLDYWDNRLLENQILFLKLSALEKDKVDKKITEVLPSWNSAINTFKLKFL